MTADVGLLQLLIDHRDDPRVLQGLLDMAKRVIAGESMESIAASYGVSLENIKE